MDRVSADVMGESLEIAARPRGAGARGLLMAGLLMSLIGMVGADAAFAEKPGTVELEVTIAHLTNEPGKIDTRAARLDKELRSQFRYEGIKLLSSRKYSLAVDEVARDELPTGRKLRVKPIIIDPKGALFAVDISGLVQTDLRLNDGQLVIIGAEKYENGKLVIALEPHL